MKTTREVSPTGRLLLQIDDNSGKRLATLRIEPECNEGQISRFEQLLNDRAGIEVCELREAFKPLALELIRQLIRQKIDGFKCDRIQALFYVSVWKEGAKDGSRCRNNRVGLPGEHDQAAERIVF